MKIKTAALVIILALSLSGVLIVAVSMHSLSSIQEIKSTWMSLEAALPNGENANSFEDSTAGPSAELRETFYKSLDALTSSGNSILYLTSATIILFILSAYWLIRIQIIKPIHRLTQSMTSIANEDLDVEIYGTEKKNEIGEMARAVEIFKDNVYLLECAKTELFSANLDLESSILSRTNALKNSEEKLRAIVETAVDAIISIDKEGNICSYNSAAESMFGYQKNEVLGQNVVIILPEAFRNSHDEYISNYLQTGKPKAIGVIREMEAVRKNGQHFPIHVSISEVKVSDDVLFTGIIRDISELKAYQKSLQASKELANSANKAKTDFVSNMSHELRTPMNAILGFAQLLEMDENEPLSASQKESVGEIKTAGKHLLSIINQILDLNKIEVGKTSIKLTKTSPTELIQESLALIIQMSHTNNIELIDDIEYEKLPDLYTDEMRFKQVLVNLLTNAVKYNKQGGKIILKTEMHHNKLRFSVKDTGKGIPLYRQTQIFVPFERLGRENSDVEGTGIGLSITKKLVEIMQGDIGFESEQDEGSVFWFELPVYESVV